MIGSWVLKLRFCISKENKTLLLTAVWADNVFDEIIRTKDKPLVDHLLGYQLPENHIKALRKFKVTS